MPINDIFSAEREKHISTALLKYPKAKAVAVRNFVGTAPLEKDIPPFGPKAANQANLRMDARSYKWTTATVNAIEFALNGIYKEAGI